ncbi:MAG TPA: hypothetical protein VEP93_00080, partial [Variovorax sp.]|nr:hypothetical protein [Variovorax sp.]
VDSRISAGAEGSAAIALAATSINASTAILCIAISSWFSPRLLHLTCPGQREGVFGSGDLNLAML